MKIQSERRDMQSRNPKIGYARVMARCDLSGIRGIRPSPLPTQVKHGPSGPSEPVGARQAQPGTPAAPGRPPRGRRALMRKQPDVRPGQVWEDGYPGNEGRRIKVVRLEERRRSVWYPSQMRYEDEVEPIAVCEVVSNGASAQVDTVGRPARIAVWRLKPGKRGYRLVEDVPAEMTGHE